MPKEEPGRETEKTPFQRFLDGLHKRLSVHKEFFKHYHRIETTPGKEGCAVIRLHV